MCGIAGAVLNDPRDLDHVLRRMNAALVHRGPDDGGTHVSGRVGLTVNRLSIIDIAGGHQPMHTEDGVSVVFNGEIYNYRGLRDALIARGCRFDTNSDTEVVLRLYHAEGVAGFRKLNGMFALAILDRRNDELILVRDPVGIKPLYHFADADTLLFASEIKAIVAALPARPAINPQAVWDFLSLRYVPPPATIWRGIWKLEPGQMLRHSLDTHRTELVRYWAPDLTPEPFDPARDYDREFEERFLAAVESHIVAADVPVGMFLSGGLDSGAICAAAIELGHRNFHTFSIGGDLAGADDELALARLTSAKFATHHHELAMTRALYFDQLDRIAWHFDEPYGDETGGALMLLSREARAYVKVALSGEGSDELLLGYTARPMIEHLGAIERKYARYPRILFKAASLFYRGRRGRILNALAAGGPRAYLKGAAHHMGWILNDGEKPAFWRGGPVAPTHEAVSRWYTLPPHIHPLAQMQQSAFQTWLVEDLLMKADKMAMAESLEVRVPFLHLPLVEWCQRSPLELRIGRIAEGEVRPKAILRNFVAKRLPPEILNAPKRGFPLPVMGWFRDELRAQQKLPLVSRALADWISVDALAPLVARAASGEQLASAALWNVVMLDRWFKLYAD
jgi:asparagine synthase (glutamine-hydrolysing)